jgi:putative DNA primase/helicase
LEKEFMNVPRIRFDQSEVQRQFREELRSHHLELNKELIADGEIHRCDAANKIGHSGRGDGAYLLRLTGSIPRGGFQNWTEDRDWVRWHFDPGRELTSTERRELEREAAQDARAHRRYLKKTRALARKKALSMWRHAREASADHPYCRRKHIKPNGERVWRFKDGGNPLLIPFFSNTTNALVNLQFIPADKGRDKYGLKGGPQSDCHYWICKPEEGDVDVVIYVVEGWATGVSVYQASEQAVIVAFNDKNLEPAARWVRERYPHNKIVVAADDDWKLPNNPGLRYAREAARAVDGLVAVPKFDEGRERKQTDFNDMHVAHGLEDVREALTAAAAPGEANEDEEDDTQEPT